MRGRSSGQGYGGLGGFGGATPMAEADEEMREAVRTDPTWYFSRLDGPQASWITATVYCRGRGMREITYRIRVIFIGRAREALAAAMALSEPMTTTVP